MDLDKVIDFTSSKFAIEVVRPYVAAHLRTEAFFVAAPWSVRRLYWKHFNELIVTVIRQYLHEDHGYEYDTLMALIDVDFINKVNPELLKKETY